MATSARIFFAGVGTTFVILAMGFGAGLMMAKSTTENRLPSQKLATFERPVAARIVHPNSADSPSEASPSISTPPVLAAQPQPIIQQAAELPKQTPLNSTLITPAETPSQAKSDDGAKSRRQLRAERRRYAERRARRYDRQRVLPDQRELGVLAFDANTASYRAGSAFFGH